MADTVNGRINISVKATYTKVEDLASSPNPITRTKNLSFTTLGAGALAYNQQWGDSRSINASSNDDLDLAGSLTDTFGATVAFARFKVLYISSTNLNTADTHLRVGAAGTNPISTLFGATNDILYAPRSGGALLIVAPDATGYAVTGGSADALRVANPSAGTTATYDIVLLGALT